MSPVDDAPVLHTQNPATRRLVASLLEVGRGEVLLAAAQGPLTLLEVPEQGAGIVLLDRGPDDAADLRRNLDRVISAQHTGVMHLVLVGGGEAEREALIAADRAAHDRDKLGVHQLTQAGRLERIAGRRLPVLEQAGTRLTSTEPLSDEQLRGLIARTRGEREELARFSARLAARRAWATLTLAALCVLMFAVSLQLGGEAYDQALLRLGSNSRPEVRDGQWWRLLSSAFLHGGTAHLFVNMLGLISFGGFLEKVLGWRRLVVLFVLSAIGGSLASVLRDGVGQSVGASGALWGLMGAGFALALSRRQVLPQLVARGLRRSLITILVVNGAISFLPQVDWLAHLGGGLVGFGLVASGLLTVGLAGGAPGAEPRGLRVAAVASVALVALSLSLALLRGRAWEPTKDPYARASHAQPAYAQAPHAPAP